MLHGEEARKSLKNSGWIEAHPGTNYKCINLVKERVGNILVCQLQHGVTQESPQTSELGVVLISVGKGRAKNKDGKGKNEARASQSNRSNQFVGFRLIRLTKHLT